MRAGETRPVEEVLRRKRAPAPAPASRGTLSLRGEVIMTDREPRENMRSYNTPFQSAPDAVQQEGMHQIRRRQRAARSSTSQGRAEPLCPRITGLNREVSEGKADV
ncbi:unnamed protein product [Ascophyllum nodosum]